MDEGLELLSEADCRSLLASGSIGRVGVTVGALPVILPVNYAYVDGGIVFRTAEGTKLRAAVDRAVIAFEVDHYDDDLSNGWSVLAVGRAVEVDGDEERDAYRALGLAPWADGTRTHYVRMEPEMLTGRRIVGE